LETDDIFEDSADGGILEFFSCYLDETHTYELEEFYQYIEPIGWLSWTDMVRIEPFIIIINGGEIDINPWAVGFIKYKYLRHIQVEFDAYKKSVRESKKPAKNPYYDRTFRRFSRVLEIAIEKRANIYMIGD
jgi:hypothetical protein